MQTCANPWQMNSPAECESKDWLWYQVYSFGGPHVMADAFGRVQVIEIAKRIADGLHEQEGGIAGPACPAEHAAQQACHSLAHRVSAEHHS